MYYAFNRIPYANGYDENKVKDCGNKHISICQYPKNSGIGKQKAANRYNAYPEHTDNCYFLHFNPLQF
jgi:hypothetical protein